MSGSLTVASASTLAGDCASARTHFIAWMGENARARAAVEASARAAVAACYHFGLRAFDDPAAFETLCTELGIRQTRSDRAANPFIRVVKAVFGRMIEDGKGGPPRWEWISDSQINKYATVMQYAQSLGLAGDDMAPWLAQDWAISGEAVPMSISRRLRQAREAAKMDGGHLPAPAALAPEAVQPRASGQAVIDALDALPSEIDLTPLSLDGMGAPDSASLILSLGESEAVRLANLPEAVLVEVLHTIRRYYQRHPAAPAADEAPLIQLAQALRHAGAVCGAAASVRIVNRTESCSVLIGGGDAGAVVRLELPPVPVLPRRRVFAVRVEEARHIPHGGRQRFQETNYARPGGLLEHRLEVDTAEGIRRLPILEIPDVAAPDPVPGYPLSDIGIAHFDAACALDRADLAALARLDSRARQWSQSRTNRRGETLTRRASRVLLASGQPEGSVRFSLRRGPAQEPPLALRVIHGQADHSRLSRAALGEAARLLLRRKACDQALLLMTHGALWVLTGVHSPSGERVSVGLPLLDAAGKPIGRGLREARFASEPEPYGAVLERLAGRLGVSRAYFR